MNDPLREPAPSCPSCGAELATMPRSGDCPRCGRNTWLVPEEDGVRVFRPTHDLIQAEPLDRNLGSIEIREGERLVLDLSQVRYIGSEALGRLLALRKRLITAKGRLVLRHANADIVEILRVTRIDSFFEFEP